MNEWIRRSIEFAHSQNYLDKLFEIYPIELGDIRAISEDDKKEIIKAFRIKNKVRLIKKLLELPVFPIGSPYIASLRKHTFLFEKNPETIERIGNRLFSMSINAILKAASLPKSPTRQLGHSFKKWLDTISIPFINENEFMEYKDTAFLKGSDTKLKKFAIEELGVRNLQKGIDFVLKIKDKFFLGEAKFLSDYGGAQNNQFNDAIEVAKIKEDKVTGIAVLDGIVWFESNNYMHRTIASLDDIALSALLLEDFIKENQ